MLGLDGDRGQKGKRERKDTSTAVERLNEDLGGLPAHRNHWRSMRAYQARLPEYSAATHAAPYRE